MLKNGQSPQTPGADGSLSVSLADLAHSLQYVRLDFVTGRAWNAARPVNLHDERAGGCYKEQYG